jgi:hypothetical protein
MTDIKKGFIYEAPVEEDFVFGADNSLSKKFAGEVLVESGDWTNWLPITEKQSIQEFETSGCVSFGTLNVIETLRRRQFDNSENLSDRFVAKGSGTLFGNTPKRVADFIRKSWSVYEQEWPFEEVKTLEEFYKDLPNNLISLAIARGAEYEFGYELVKVSDMRGALKYSPLGMSVPAWWQDDKGLYYRPQGISDGHWVMCFGMQPNGNYLVFDSYYPYLKELRADINPSVVMRYHLKRQVVVEDAWQKFLNLIKTIFGFPLGRKHATI